MDLLSLTRVEMRSIGHVTIVLRSGDRIYGLLHGVEDKGSKIRTQRGLKEIEEDSVMINYRESSGEVNVYVPVPEIRTVFPSDFTQENNEEAEGTAYGRVPPIIEEKIEENTKAIKKHDFLCTYSETSQPEPVDVPDLNWGDTQYDSHTQIYADLDYFERDSNITDVGITLFGFGFTIGGTRDTDRKAKKRIKSDKPTSIDSIDSTTEEITIAGTANQIESSQDDSDWKMENKTWIPFIVTEDGVSKSDELENTEWCLCWFAQDWFHLPSEYALNTDQVIRVYGEVVPSPIEVEFGSPDYAIKARAAAYCGD